jgi:hypothetical protein
MGSWLVSTLRWTGLNALELAGFLVMGAIVLVRATNSTDCEYLCEQWTAVRRKCWVCVLVEAI